MDKAELFFNIVDNVFKSVERKYSVKDLIGQNIVNIDTIKYENDIIELHFITDKNKYIFYHEQECCESVWLEDVTGDLNKLIGNQIQMCECVVSEDNEHDDGVTQWTFYKIADNKGNYVTLRWCGDSNGWYSTSVNFTVEPIKEGK